MQINLTIVHVLPKQAPNLTTEKQISGCLEMRQRGKTVRLQRGAGRNRDFASHTIQGHFKKFGPKLNGFTGKHEIIRVITLAGS